MSESSIPGRLPPILHRPVDWKSLAIQAWIVLVFIWLGWHAIENVAANMRARNIPTTFDFLWATSGFDLNQSLIPYSATSTYGRAFFVGLLNTLSVAALGIVFATLIGFIVGIARLSQNWLVAKLAMIYVEVIRNTPLLLQLFFWYTAVLAPLPGPRLSLALPALSLRAPDRLSLMLASLLTALAILALIFARRQMKDTSAKAVSYAIAGLAITAMALVILFGAKFFGIGDAAGVLDIAGGSSIFLNNRGLFIPTPAMGDSEFWLAVTLGLSLCAAAGFTYWAKRQRNESGRILPAGWINAALIMLPFIVVFMISRESLSLEYPQLRGFNFVGGTRIYPEFFALLLGLSLYTAAFIAEIIRAGILSVSRGQSEAAAALGLRRSSILKLVVIPQAMRVVIPPLTNQYLNLTKNSSLAVFIGFPDLVQVFVGTVLNQTGAMIQIISITMAVYLTISLLTSLAMNFYNSRMALAER